MEENHKFLKILIAGLVLFSLFIGFSPQAKAQEGGLWETLVGTSQYGPAYLIWAAQGKLIALFGEWLDASLSTEVLQNFSREKTLNDLWVLTRDIMNMFFILALLIAAFGTIFNIQKFKVGDLLPKIIIAALLINFSLIIGQAIIDVFNFISVSILRTMGVVSVRFAELGSISQLQPSSSQLLECFKSPLTCTTTKAVELIGLTVFLGLALISLLFAAIFVFFRIPILTFLLIISPIAWATYAFPTVRKFFSVWWHNFLYWNYFLAIFLFFLFLGFSYMQGGAVTVFNSFSDLENLDFGRLTMRSIVKNMVAILTVLGGILLASKAGSGGARYTIAVGKWVAGATGVPGAYRKVVTGVQREGIRGFGGAIKRERKEERLAGVAAKPLGLRGVGIEAQRAKEKRVNEEIDLLKAAIDEKKITEGELQKIMLGKDDKAIAAKILVAKSGGIPKKQFIKDIDELDPRTLVGKKYVDEVIKNSPADLRDTFQQLAAARGDYALGPKVRYAAATAANHLKEKNELYRFDDWQMIRSTLELYEAEKGKDAAERFKTDLKKARVDLITRVDAPEADADKLSNLIYDEVSKMRGVMGNWNFLRDQNYQAYKNPEFRKTLTKIIKEQENERTERTKQGLPAGPSLAENLERYFAMRGEDDKLNAVTAAIDEATKP